MPGQQQQPPVAVAQPMPGQPPPVAVAQPVPGQPVVAMAQPVMGMPVAGSAAVHPQYPNTMAPQPQVVVQQPTPMEIHHHHYDDGDPWRSSHNNDDPTCGWILFFMGACFSPIFCCFGMCATSGEERGPRTKAAFRANCIGSGIWTVIWVAWIIAAVVGASAAASSTPPAIKAVYAP